MPVRSDTARIYLYSTTWQPRYDPQYVASLLDILINSVAKNGNDYCNQQTGSRGYDPQYVASILHILMNSIVRNGNDFCTQQTGS